MGIYGCLTEAAAAWSWCQVGCGAPTEARGTGVDFSTRNRQTRSRSLV